jgi:two-component system NtrC family sensor kinase
MDDLLFQENVDPEDDHNKVVLSSIPRKIDVLLVDDQEIIGKVIQKMLVTEPDIALHYYSDPRQALQSALKHPPTVILLDLEMPEIDGLLLLRWLRLHSVTQDTPIMMLSAKEEPELKAKAFTQGANDYLIKPPDVSELIARLRYHARAYCNYRKMVAATRLAQAQSKQLEQTLQKLQATQAQLIQTEKLAGLEQLVAGMAHEINNPINFIYGNLNHAQDYSQQLLTLIQFYQRVCPRSCPHLNAQPEVENLEFIAEDLPKLLTSMKVGAERIRQIILSLRNFSHLDQADVKAVDIHEGMESTLLILHHRLKAKLESSEIQIVKDYGKLPLVECYPAQLNQVFLNVLSNAIDAIEQSRKPLVETSAGQIVIQTAVSQTANDSASAIIRIADNGCGISESIQSRIFDPFFTTKPVGKGTGLGLAISYQIVVNQHQGAFKCISQPEQGTEFWIEIPIRLLHAKAI